MVPFPCKKKRSNHTFLKSNCNSNSMKVMTISCLFWVTIYMHVCNECLDLSTNDDLVLGKKIDKLDVMYSLELFTK